MGLRAWFRSKDRRKADRRHLGDLYAATAALSALAANGLISGSATSVRAVELGFGVFFASVSLLSLAGLFTLTFNLPPHRRKRDEFLYIVIESLRNQLLGQMTDWRGWSEQMHAFLRDDDLEHANRIMQLVTKEVTSLQWIVPTSDKVIAQQLGPDAGRHYAESPDWSREAPTWIRGDAWENTWRAVAGRIDWLTNWLRESAES